MLYDASPIKCMKLLIVPFPFCDKVAITIIKKAGIPKDIIRGFPESENKPI